MDSLSANQAKAPNQQSKDEEEDSSTVNSINMDLDSDLPIREIDTSSIQQQMSKNKEQLQIKLMVRRSINQLVEQGILPRKFENLKFFILFYIYVINN